MNYNTMRSGVLEIFDPIVTFGGGGWRVEGQNGVSQYFKPFLHWILMKLSRTVGDYDE